MSAHGSPQPERTPSERTEVGAAVVVRAARVLVQTRPPGLRYAGWWEFPGGKLEDGEDVEACVVRECREELALDVRPGERLHVEEWSYPGRAVRVTFVLCAVDADDSREPVAVEGQDLRWATVADLGRLRFLPANARVLELLVARLGGSGSGGPGRG